MISAMRRLDFLGWIYGLLHAAIGGGASAVTAGFSASMIAPKELSFGGMASLKLMGLCFAMSAAFSMFLYLKESPLPKIIEETKTTTISSVTTEVLPKE